MLNPKSMPNGDAIREALAPLENKVAKIDERLSDGEAWKIETTKILSRLSTIVVGDNTIGHKGLVERIQEHSTYILAQENLHAEIRGGKKMLVFISAISGALLSKVADAAMAFYSAKGH